MTDGPRRALLSLFAFAYLLPALPVLGAGALPDAATVAQQSGSSVEFEDGVKAVSYSRTRKGRYLSFGDAFPKQVLSVWVKDEFWGEMPTADGLLNRTVRIRGQIENSSTGPLIHLEGPEQFELLPLDEAAVLQKDLDGRSGRQHFKAVVVQNFERGAFSKLEAQASELLKTRARFNDGTWQLQAFYDAFDLPGRISQARYDWTAQALDKWLEAHPFSVHAIILKANLQVDSAWKARGEGYAHTVTEEGSEGFRRELAAARQLLEANGHARSSSHFFVTMQSVALGEGWPKHEYFRLLQDGIEREPDYYQLYFSAAHYLPPRWHGAEGEWEEFAEQQRRRRGGVEGDILYTRIVWSMGGRYRGSDLFKKSAVSWEQMAAGFDSLVRQRPDSAYVKNAYAHFAYRAGDRKRLLALLGEILDAPDMSIWVNQENVENAKNFAVSSSD